MTLREKAKEIYGNNYIEQCPAKLFGIGCFADNTYPYCGHESCWKQHKTDSIQYTESKKDVFFQQMLGS